MLKALWYNGIKARGIHRSVYARITWLTSDPQKETFRSKPRRNRAAFRAFSAKNPISIYNLQFSNQNAEIIDYNKKKQIKDRKARIGWVY